MTGSRFREEAWRHPVAVMVVAALLLRLATLSWGIGLGRWSGWHHPDESKVWSSVVGFPGNYLSNRNFLYGTTLQYAIGPLLLPFKRLWHHIPALPFFLTYTQFAALAVRTVAARDDPEFLVVTGWTLDPMPEALSSGRLGRDFVWPDSLAPFWYRYQIPAPEDFRFYARLLDGQSGYTLVRRWEPATSLAPEFSDRSVALYHSARHSAGPCCTPVAVLVSLLHLLSRCPILVACNPAP